MATSHGRLHEMLQKIRADLHDNHPRIVTMSRSSKFPQVFRSWSSSLKSEARDQQSESIPVPIHRRSSFCSLLSIRPHCYAMLSLGLFHLTIGLTGAYHVSSSVTCLTRTSPSLFYRNRRDHVSIKRHAQDNANNGRVDHVDHHHSDTQSKPGWRRRVLSRLRRERASGSLKATLHAETATVTTRTSCLLQQNVDQLILEKFEKLSPEQLFATLEARNFVLDDSTAHGLFYGTPVELPLDSSTATFSSEASSVANTGLSVAEENQQKQFGSVLPTSQIGDSSSFEGGPPIRKMVRSWFQKALTNCFHQHATEPPVNLKVRCSPTGSVFSDLLRGQFQCNVRADFDRIVFNFIQCSGGSLEGSRLALNLLAFTVNRSKELAADANHSKANQKASAKLSDRTKFSVKEPTSAATTSKKTSLMETKKASPRYQKPFDLHANDCVFSQDDLFASPCVRNGLQNLVTRMMKRRGFNTKSVFVTDISVLRSGKISCKGEATLAGIMPYTKVTFEVRSGIAFKNRGHVITFPGLELSLSPDMGLFVPIPNVELDIGHDARLRELHIDGHKKYIKLAASVTITPDHTRKLGHEYIQCGDAYSAKFNYDVGRWLTRIGRFSL